MAEADAPATCPTGHVDTTRLLSVFASTSGGGDAGAPELGRAADAAAAPAAAADLMTPRHASTAPGRCEQLGDTRFDVLVIGGGITGAGVALDAAIRGLRTALVERDDFASGTSSKSSKLVHGGLRYLQNGDVRLVYEALRERQRLRHNAPHLVRLLPFLIPIFSKDGLINPKVARALGSAMWMYDLTGGARIGKLHKRLKKAEAVAHMPTLPEDRLAGALPLLRRRRRRRPAHAHARAHRGPRPRRGGRQPRRRSSSCSTTTARPTGAVIEADGQRIEVRARAVVNAAGVWTDDVRALDEGGDPDSIRPAKGIHITVPWEQGAQRHRRGRARAEGQALRVRGAVAPHRRRRLRAHLHRHHRHRLRRPDRRSPVHGRRHRLPAAGHQLLACGSR